MPAFKRYDPNDMHWLLIKETAALRNELDKEVLDDDWVQPQALFCPYYVTLDGCLGGDWGVILNPESKKFGRLVFEHEWCGCPVYRGPLGDWFTEHGEGKQSSDEWAVPRSRQKIVRRTKRWQEKKRREQEPNVR